ncbi:hypothetical protein GTV15_01250 [Streptomyces sp. SID7803]|nr:hypothetical protein [Streptomyces sp. SID7803]
MFTFRPSWILLQYTRVSHRLLIRRWLRIAGRPVRHGRRRRRTVSHPPDTATDDPPHRCMWRAGCTLQQIRAEVPGPRGAGRRNPRRTR